MTSPERSYNFDWRAWLALIWAVGFGLLYVKTVLYARAPGLLAAMRHLFFG